MTLNFIKKEIFKLNDIRGEYPHQINEKVAQVVAGGFLRILKKKSKKNSVTIIISRDDRKSSPALLKGLKRGLAHPGVKVIDISPSPTPLFYFAVWKNECEGGIQITASHNAFEENGFKLIQKTKKEIFLFRDFEALKKEIALFEKTKNEKPPSIVKKSYAREYFKFIFKKIPPENFSNFKIYIKYQKGFPIEFLTEFKKIFSGQIKILRENENFPAKIAEQKNKIGVFFDADGDRIFFAKNSKIFFMPEIIAGVILETLLKRSKNKKVVYTAFASNILKEAIEKNGGVGIPSKVGHALVKEKMRESGAFLGIEYSSHYIFKEFGFSEAPLYVLMLVAQNLKKTGKSLWEITEKYRTWENSGVFNLKTKNKEKVLEEIKKKYQEGKISTFDGVRIDFKDWWLGARPSQTEDYLRLIVEAKKKSVLEENLTKVREFIKKYSQKSTKTLKEEVVKVSPYFGK